MNEYVTAQSEFELAYLETAVSYFSHSVTWIMEAAALNIATFDLCSFIIVLWLQNHIYPVLRLDGFNNISFPSQKKSPLFIFPCVLP